MLKVINLSVRYGKRVLFENVNLEFTEGNCYGVIGANGAGKSTLLKILTGQIESTTGEVIKDKGERLSYLKQNHNLYNDYTVIDTVIMGNDRLYKIMKEKEALYMKEDFTYAHRCSNRALKFLDEYKDEDFVLIVSYDEPHGPCLCPAPYNTMYQGFKFDDDTVFNDNLENKPLMQRLWAGEALHQKANEINKPSKQLALFLGCNSFVDYEIGRVIDKVNEITPDAMIIFTSDHGDMLGAHKLQMKNACAYKEIANIPLIIKYKEKGKTVSYPASHIDLAPTILDYMNVKIPKAFEGKSMLKQIEDPSIRINDEVFLEFTRYEVDHDGFGGLQMMRAVVDDRYKLVINLLDSDEFYDLEKDPYEVNNLINDESYKDVRNKLHDKLLDNMNRTRDLYRGYQWAARPWRKDKVPNWNNDGYTRQRENEENEPRQLDYDTGLPMVNAVRKKILNDEKK